MTRRRHDVDPGKDMWPKSTLPVEDEDGIDPEKFFVGCEVVILVEWPGLPKGTIGKVVGISRAGWLEIDWGFSVAWNSASGWKPDPKMFRVIGGSPEKPRVKVQPQPLTLVWVGGGYGLRPRLLGTVPEGTKAKDVDTDYDAVVGTLDEFLSAYLNPGSDY